jgi:general secretion pathway protein I
LHRLTRAKAPADAAGFTLIEVVVALAVIAVMLVSIGSVVGASVRGSHALDEHLVLVEMIRGLRADIADRNALKFGSISGATAGRQWRIDVRPFVNAAVDPGVTMPWQPVTETITVRSPFGTSLSVTTLRLRQRPAE